MCLLSGLPASAAIEAHFVLDETIRKATHVVLVEAADGGFQVIESWAGDVDRGAVLDCLDLYPVDPAHYARLVAEAAFAPYTDQALPQGSTPPLLIDGLVFVPENVRLVLFLRETPNASTLVVPTVELLPERRRRFASVTRIPPAIVTSVVWPMGERVYHFGTIFAGGPRWPEPIRSLTESGDGTRPPMAIRELRDLVAAREGDGEPAEPGARSEEEAAWLTRVKRAIKAGQFHEVNLRLFPEGEVVGESHQPAAGQVLGTRVIVQSKTIPDTAVLLCVPDDQTNPVAAEALSNRVRLWAPNQSARLDSGHAGAENRNKLQILDALGEPIPGATVSVAMWNQCRGNVANAVPLGERVTNEVGEVQLPELPEGREGVPEWYYTPLAIVHPQYGSTRALWQSGVVNADPKLRTSLLRGDPKANDRALRGVVVDAEGEPVAGASVVSESVRPPGLLISGYGVAVTDELGRFRLHLVRRRAPRQTDWSDSPIPPNSQYAYTVKPPKGAGLRPASGWASNAEPVRIVLESEAAFAARGAVHTFTFEGGFPASDTARAGIQVAVRSDDAGFGVDLVTPCEEHLIPNGTYYAWITGGGTGSETRHFEPLVVTFDSPKELAFRLVQARCTGQIINGVTGAPMPGVLCLVGAESWIPLRLAFEDLPEALRDALAQPGTPPRDVEQLAAPLRADFPLLTAVVTNENGHYDAAVPAGKDIKLVYVIREGHVPAARHVYSGNPGDRKQFDLDPIPLYPAAHARVRVVGAAGPCRATWEADALATASWAVPLKGYEDRTEHSLEIMTGRFQAGQHDATFLVPASAPLRVTIHPSGPGLVPVHVAETVRVEPGHAADLGEVRFAKAFNIPAVVHVVDEEGNPIEGVPVGTLAGNSWSPPTLTDADGVAKLHVSPGITRKLGVWSVGLDATIVIDPDLAETARIEHTVKLSQEQRGRLFAHPGGL